ncbi:UNVERIFIED_ORG: hypothetical protein B2H93_17300 [Clostridium botulinum]
MPIYKRCSRCNKRILEGTKCDCLKARHKEYKHYRTDKKEQSFYSSKEWLPIKEKAKALYDGIDIYSYYVLNKLEYGQTMHHIEELKDNWDRRLDINNLIYLTESNHQIIHKLYKEGKKKETMELLFYLIEKFKSEFGK